MWSKEKILKQLMKENFDCSGILPSCQTCVKKKIIRNEKKIMVKGCCFEEKNIKAEYKKLKNTRKVLIWLKKDLNIKKK